MSQASSRGPVLRAIVGVWNGMNFLRRLVLNLLFFFLLLLFLMVLAGGRGGVVQVQDRSTLVIAPEAQLVEQYTTDPVSRSFMGTFGQGPAEVQLRDLLAVLDAAREDAKIERVLLRVDRMSFSGFASLRELGEAIDELRAAGKQVVAFGERFTQAQYLLAAHADEVYLDPEGEVLLLGLSGYRQFYREGLQDKLGIDMHLFKVGEYKSAAEPFVRDDASPEAKEADLFWRGDVWRRYLEDVARLRKTTAGQLAASIDALPEGIAAVQGDTARYAFEQKLVDGLKTREEVEQLLAERGVADDDAEGGFRQVGFFDYLRSVDGLSAAAKGRRPQVAVVVAEGEIVEGRQPPGRIGSESTAALLREAREDDDVKAVVLRVNSPGGSAFASEIIRREIVALKEADKPVVVSFGDVAASGGYWISMDGDRIFADPSTITGSIGIFGLVPTFPRALEKIGVHTDGVATTRMAGAFDLTRPLSPELAQLIQSYIDKGYRDFIGRVAQGRGRTPEQIDEVARGRVWTGAQAHERGLVDEFGGLRAAIADAASRARLGEPEQWRVRYIERGASPFERWFSGFLQGRLARHWLRESDFARGLLARAVPQAERDLRLLEDMLKTRDGAPVKVLAHCFCGI
ncbi:protease-4 [Luteimonas sp. J16]|jgi:protease-4|uniref:signal peptide peptidase SppA n=1 Tax=unclassified Luteimonas TaxID=2629088 RepID=UPI00047CFD33|nr:MULTISPECIES: signal peptide peptidase SppA [unclassified Luteimonas]TWG88386.1 protease-4 [Luteimonas sp. J16]